MSMREMQFTAIVLMSLLTLKLLLLPRKVSANSIVNRARWLMVGGTALLVLQFLLQYILRLRAMGVTQAVMLNLALFIPASWLFSMALIYLQGWGRIKKADEWVGGVTCVVVLTMLGYAAYIDGQPLLTATPELRSAEIGGSVCYAVMLAYYACRHFFNLHSIRRALDNYYDSNMFDMLWWMRLSVILLPIMVLVVPLIIFVHGLVQLVFSLALFAALFFLEDSFCNYVVSSAPAKVEIAEMCEDEFDEIPPMDEDNDSEGHSASEIIGGKILGSAALQRMEDAISAWTAAGGHLRSGLTMPNAAKEMLVPRYLLSAWLKQTGRRYNDWLADLRINEAKRVLKEHPEWSNEFVAEHCGFNDRSYFQRKFKEKTGLSPAEYLNATDRR